MKTINQNLKRVRKAKGLNQTELAEQVGNDWTQRIVSRLEQGQEMTVTQLEELLRVLGPDILAGSLLENLVSEDFAFLAQQKRIDAYLDRLHKILTLTMDSEREIKILRRVMQGQSEEDAEKAVDASLPPQALPGLERVIMEMEARRFKLGPHPAEGTAEDAAAWLKDQEAQSGVDQETT
ncbi:helix-turn-helix transcriptional regulator [Brevibacterium sp. K11IcPPYGO002]|uniref:helix-turn-helix domain-containing protein n=1 Tax=Brevibacterium sp. K11IcPPYGO002 TaxID=3058837 RepID=UPI003D818705